MKNKVRGSRIDHHRWREEAELKERRYRNKQVWKEKKIERLRKNMNTAEIYDIETLKKDTRRRK